MIQGVVVKKLSLYEDHRGWLTEAYRSDETPYKPEMAYVSFTKHNKMRGPHEHRKQSDFFIFTGPGKFIVYLWDNRKLSPTYKEKAKLVAGEEPISILIPPGVVHAYKCISKTGGFNVNFPNMLYKGKDKKEEVDEIRHESDPSTEFKEW